jgi:hypothetical protein
MRILVSVGFVTHILLGTFCMMPMAYAAPMPMQHDEAMEINMTPMAPMSMAHCEHCTHVDEQSNAPMGSGCAGHCLAKAHDALTAAVAVSFGHQIALALPPTFPIVAEPAYISAIYHSSTAPPINFASARGVVMIN